MKKKIIVTVTMMALIMIAGFGTTACSSKEPGYDDIDFKEYVNLGDYKGLAYTVATAEVPEDEFQSEIDRRLSANASTKTVKEGVVEDGDTINVAYEGKVDGKTFEGGSTDSSDITIGKDQMIDGFIEGLIGKEVGETVILNLKFPENYHEKSLSGKDVVFTVTIKGKQEKEIPELTDEWVSTNTDFKNVEEFKESIGKELKEAKEAQENAKIKSDLWNKVFESSKIKKYPENQVKYQRKKIIEQYKEQAEKDYKMSYEEFLKTYEDSTPKKFDKKAKSYAESVVAQKLVMYYIAKEEKLTVTDKEYKAHLKKTLKEAGFSEKTFKDNYEMSIEEYAEKYDWRTSMLYDKVTERIKELGTAN